MQPPLICNVCGKTFTKEDTYEDFKIEHDFGYGSERDGDKLRLNACCTCQEIVAKWLEDMCIISPILPYPYLD